MKGLNIDDKQQKIQLLKLKTKDLEEEIQRLKDCALGYMDMCEELREEKKALGEENKRLADHNKSMLEYIRGLPKPF